MSLELAGTVAAAVCTLGIYSFLYKENLVHRFFEHIFLGLFGAYGVVVTWSQVLKPKWWDPMAEGFSALLYPGPGRSPWGALWVLALLLGSLWYFIYSKKRVWLSRLVIGLFLGAGAGLAFKLQFGANMPQLYSSFKPLTSLNNLVFMGTLVCVMTYFFFSFEHRNPALRGGARAGRWLLMITFGAFFGNTVMARLSLFIERLQFLREAGVQVFRAMGG